MEFKNPKGLSLVEVMVATGIFLLAMMFLSNVVISGIKTARVNKQRLELVTITSSVLEEIKGNHHNWQKQGLKGWLENQGWVKKSGDIEIERIDGDQFTKTIIFDNKEYLITIILKEINSGFWDITVTTEISGLTPMIIITRMRG